VEEKKSVWKWVERTSVFCAMVLGVIAFIWQLQERVTANQEQIITSLINPRYTQDTLVTVDLVFWNVGRKTVHIRSIEATVLLPDSLYPSPDLARSSKRGSAMLSTSFMRAFQDSAVIREIEPEQAYRIRSEPMSFESFDSLSSNPALRIRTLKGRYFIRPDYRDLRWVYNGGMIRLRDSLRTHRQNHQRR
jgi:hypothetical protein